VSLGSIKVGYIYLYLSAISVREKRECLPEWWNPEMIAAKLFQKKVEVEGALDVLQDANLIGRLEDGRIYVYDTRKRHKRLRSWHLDDDAVALDALSVPYERTETEHGGQLLYHPPGTKSVHSAEREREERERQRQRREIRQAIVQRWRGLASQHSLKTVYKLSNARRGHLDARLADEWWRDHWEESMAHIPKSPFLMGDNDRGWKATFDWFLKPDTAAKVLEGAYDGKPKDVGSPRGGRSFEHGPDQEGKFDGIS
jgi:hypothetical protein